MSTPKARNPSLRVIMISNNHMIRVGSRMILEAHPNISLVRELSGGPDAVEVVAEEKPEVILIDLDVAGVLDLIRKFHVAAKDSHILILAGLNDEELTREALCSGAAGVVLKMQPPAVIFAAIESACSNASKTLVSLLPALGRIVHYAKTNDSELSKAITSLTTREREIIPLIGEGFRNKDIADRLCISETTVRHHLTSIFTKLEVSNRQRLLIVAHQYGLIELKPLVEHSSR